LLPILGIFFNAFHACPAHLACYSYRSWTHDSGWPGGNAKQALSSVQSLKTIPEKLSNK
jgi:hypothetical protein